MEAIVDILKIYDRLRQDGAFDEKAARAVAGVIQDLVDSELVRKGELKVASESLRLEIEQVRSEIAQVRLEIEQVRLEVEKVRSGLTTEIEKVRSALTKEIEKLRADLKLDIQHSKLETIKWVLGIMLAQTGILIGAIKLLR